MSAHNNGRSAVGVPQSEERCSPGQDEVGADMMMAECLADVWLNLFQVCWEYSIVPSVWKESTVIPVPKKQVRGVCTREVDDFRGISL